jgi:hypothetical protein
MASKSKRARMEPKQNFARVFLAWALLTLSIKLIIIFKIPSQILASNPNFNLELDGKPDYLVDGIWFGADGENYLRGFTALARDGVFSSEQILNYWPAGYPLIILILSIFGQNWVLTTLAIIQSMVFAWAAYFFAIQLLRTRLKNFAFLVFILIIFNPTLSLSSITIGYESFTASGFLLLLAIIMKDLIERDNSKFKKYLVLNSLIVGLLTFMQPRLIIAGITLNIIWILSRNALRVGSLLVALSLAVTLFFPAALIYRNNKSVGLDTISTNLGITMNIGAGDGATGGYIKEGYGVPCQLSGDSVQQDSQRVNCVLKWYVNNPAKAATLFYNKSVYFWSPWFGPAANGTMARNPWLKISPLKNITSTQEGINLVFGSAGKIISWLWLVGGLIILFYGYIILWKAGSIERFIANLIMIVIGSNWLISLISIGDHRFRIPIMGLSLFLQAIGLKTLLRGGKPAMVDGPALR